MKYRDNSKTSISNNTDIIPIPQVYQDKLPYIKDIRLNWVTNQEHCSENSPSKRENFIKNNIRFAEEWIGEVGFLRYYLFHIDSNYIPMKSQLERIDKKKGFSPDNCRIIDKLVQKSIIKKETKKSDKIVNNHTNPKQKVNSHETPVNITNNMFLTTSEENRTEIIKALLMTLGVSFNLVDEQKGIMLLYNKSNVELSKAQ